MLSTIAVNRRGPPPLPRAELGIHGVNRWTVKCLEKSEKRGVQAARTGPSEDSKCWQRTELGIHGLNRWTVKCLEMSRKRGDQTDKTPRARTASVGSAFERFFFVLRTSWVWAGSRIPQAPKERQFIAWRRQPQDSETRQKKPFPAPAGRQSRRGRALLSPRLGLGTGKGWGRGWGHPGAYASRL